MTFTKTEQKLINQIKRSGELIITKEESKLLERCRTMIGKNPDAFYWEYGQSGLLYISLA